MGDDFKLTTFEKCLFSSCDFSGVWFKHTGFVKCSFAGSKLSNLDFAGTHVSECDFSETLMQNCLFQQFKGSDQNKHELMDLRGCRFTQADLSRSVFIHGDLTNVLFDDAVLKEVVFERCVLKKTVLVGADVTLAQFDSSKVEEVAVGVDGMVQLGMARGFVLGVK